MIYLALAAFVSFPVWAEKFPVGAGGDAVVCRDSSGKITSAEALDHYEGRVYRNIPHVTYPELSNREYFEQMHQRIEILLLEKSDWFLEKSEKIDSAINEFKQTGKSKDFDFLFTNDQLINFSDFEKIVPVKGCKVEQAILVNTPVLPNDPSYLIRGEIIQALDQEGIRGLILNLLLIERIERRYEGHSDGGLMNKLTSETARYINQKITSVKLENLSFNFFRTSLTYVYYRLRNKLGIYYTFGNFKPKTIEGHLSYESWGNAYVLNDDGSVNEALTLKHGYATFKLNYQAKISPGTQCRYSCQIELPKGGSLKLTHENGTKYDVIINEHEENSGSHNNKFSAGPVTVTAIIPSQIRITLGILKKPFDHGELSFGEKLIFDSIKANGRKHESVVRIGLNENKEWAVLQD